MTGLQTDRRSTPAMPNALSCTMDRCDAIDLALAIQARVGTVSAVEYLKAHDIDGATISRVLTSARSRRH